MYQIDMDFNFIGYVWKNDVIVLYLRVNIWKIPFFATAKVMIENFYGILIWVSILLLDFFFYLFLFFRAAPMAYGGSHARGLIRATAAGLRYSHNTRSESRVCDLYHSSRQHQILNPLSEARGRTCNLMVPSRTCFHCAMTELQHSYTFIQRRSQHYFKSYFLG